MTPEERLRRAIAARARSVEPSDDGLDRITEKLLDPGGDMKFDPSSTTTRWYLVAAAAVVLVGIAGGIAVASGGGDDGERTDNGVVDEPTTTESTESTTTTTTSTTSTTAAPGITVEPPGGPPVGGIPEDIASRAVWPRPSSTVRFDDPVAAARSWARYYAGFADPVVGEFQQGDNRSGEVPIRPTATSQATTTALVRRLSDDSWYVIGSVTGNISVSEPSPSVQLTCPQVLRGNALAFEGTVQVRIDAYQADGKRVEVGSGFVTGSGSPPAGPFDDTISCRIPTGVEDYGVVNFYTANEADGNAGTWESVTFPIRLR